ncbi:MAG: Mu-like prophage major head subunit gpT family protein [Anaerolineales bacterium]|jgi:hypothetical protein|nr:Mu-like prophage major head subunit gpT family protein [Anaerolineales bacterium]|tara:strand:+ start:1037 stop:1954 length:918 start_codon:yes stop_codon:yes gene_type:complete
MALNRSLFTKQLNLGLNTIFGMEYDTYPEQWRQVYTTETSKKAFEEDVQMYGFGAAPVKAEGAPISYDSGAEGIIARYVHETIALAFAITEEAEEDGLYGSLGAKYAKALARSMQHTKEIKGMNILNNGFSSSSSPVYGGDGLTLFSKVHPLGGGGTNSNQLATNADLSETSLEAMLILITEMVDDRQIPIAAQGVKLVVPPELMFVAERIVASNLRPGTADNDINATKSLGMIPQGVAVNQRLTDPDAFFIMTDVPDGLKHFVRRPIKKSVEGDFETGNLRYKVSERYSFGFTDWRGAFGTPGA